MARGATRANSKAAGKSRRKVDVPDVYRDMLADTVSSFPTRTSADGRAVKRRRVGGRVVIQANDSPQSTPESKATNEDNIDDLFNEPKPGRQRIEQTESEDSTESDVDWEEINLKDSGTQGAAVERDFEESGELNLVLGGDERRTSKSAQVRLKPVTAAEKKLRLEIHKMHLCSLLVHVYIRNHWCNDESVHSALKRLLMKKTVSYLNPDEGKSQFQRSRSFMDGLTQASETFRAHFKIRARGMSKPFWADSPETLAHLQPPEDIDLPIQKADFVNAAQSLEGSRDVGAQLFCAMLRSAGVDARLVCSLLPLPFQRAQKSVLSQAKQYAVVIPVPGSRESTPGNGSGVDAGSDGSVPRVRTISSNDRRVRFDQTKRSASPELSSSKLPVHIKKSTRKPIHESKFPVYWIEALNEAVQKWIPVDPLVAKTIAKSTKFEPPAGDPGNNMTYVIAFEDDGSARDVTRRYTKAYNAKTRRDRVEVTKGGERWWRRVIGMYRRSHELDRDQVEDAELAAKEAAEPMPKNVQDFKDHPYYALERHLRRHEVIHPKREVGKVNSGRAGSTNAVEPIYRRRDVHQLKSADKWYRLGREIKPGEQPLKRVAARRTREANLNTDDMEEADEDNAGTALYAAHQTTLYCPPPVINGRIPKNVYGNLDVYAASMVPPGAAYLFHPETARAARVLGIDYADAVTGFAFKGRHGMAVTNGAVVAAEYKEAVEEVIEAFEDEKTREEEQRRIFEALRMWKRFLAGLRIRERIEGYEIEGERDMITKEEMEKLEEDDEGEEGGGFLPDGDAEEPAQPTAGKVSFQDMACTVGNEEGGFLADEDQDEENNLNNRRPQAPDIFLNGFINEDDDDGGGGGFVLDDPEDQDAEEALQDARVGEDSYESGNHEPKNAGPIDTASQEMLDHGGNYAQKELDREDTLNTRDSQPLETIHDVTHLLGNSRQSKSPEVSKLPDNLFLELHADELEKARILQQLHEAQQKEPLSLSQTAVLTDEGNGRPIPTSPTDGGDEDTGAFPDSNAATASSMGEEKQDITLNSSESDRGSLLSQDPDDEDANPEWLE